jgi:hypothetical protein
MTNDQTSITKMQGTIGQKSFKRLLTSTHQRYDFQAVALAQLRIAMFGAGHDLLIQFNSDVRLRDA